MHRPSEYPLAEKFSSPQKKASYRFCGADTALVRTLHRFPHLDCVQRRAMAPPLENLRFLGVRPFQRQVETCQDHVSPETRSTASYDPFLKRTLCRRPAKHLCKLPARSANVHVRLSLPSLATAGPLRNSPGLSAPCCSTLLLLLLEPGTMDQSRTQALPPASESCPQSVAAG